MAGLGKGSVRDQLHAHYDMVIVGGGMVGASLACLLCAARSDWRVLLVEAFALPAAGESSTPIYQPSFDARSTALSYGSIEIFRALDLWPTLAEHASSIRRVHVSDRGHFGGALVDAEDQAVSELGSVVENAWLGAVLLARLHELPNLTCVAPAKLEKIQPRRAGVSLTLRAGSTASGSADSGVSPAVALDASLVIIADGADSDLAASLGIAYKRKDYRQAAIIANVSYSEPHQGVAYERFTDQGPLALLPLDGERGRRSALVWTQPEDQVEQIQQLDDRAFLALLQQRFGHRLGKFEQVGQRHAYPLSMAVAEEQVRSGLVLMGNAAHFLHPVAGQGFNLALRDCASLVEALLQAEPASGRDSALGSLPVLQAYLQQQQLDQQVTGGFSDGIVRLFSNAQLPAMALRHLGFIGLETIPQAKDFLARQTMGRMGRLARLKP